MAQEDVEQAWKTIIVSLGYDASSPHFEGTPERVARFLTGWHEEGKPAPKLTTFPNVPPVDQLVVVSGLSFYSMCAHHGVPFFGRAAVGYLPGESVLGLSKFARVIDHFAHRYTTQEVITEHVATFLEDALSPRGVGVVLEAEHLCMSMRGVCKPGHKTVTSALRGALLGKAEARAELMALLR